MHYGQFLRKAGVNEKLFRAFKGIYTSVSACVRDKYLYTDFFKCPRGEKQSWLLCPLVFSFLINDLAVKLSASMVQN